MARDRHGLSADRSHFRGGRLDGNEALINFCQTLEQVCIDVVESGRMTKDLAVCIYGNKVSEDQYLYTEDFLEALNSELKARLA